MVWGMSIPSSFGDYWPEGDFESLDPHGKGGWRDRLNRYYQSQSPELQRALYDYTQGGDIASYPIYVTSKFYQELGVRPTEFPELAPLNSIKDHEPPQCYITAKSYSFADPFNFFATIIPPSMRPQPCGPCAELAGP